VEVRLHSVAEGDLARDGSAVGKLERQRACRIVVVGSHADERAMPRAVVQTPVVVDEVEPPVAGYAPGRQLDVPGGGEGDGLDRRDGDQRGGRRLPPSQSAIVPAIATFSESPASTGIVARVSQPCATASGSPTRSAPRTNVTGSANSTSVTGAPPCAS